MSSIDTTKRATIRCDVCGTLPLVGREFYYSTLIVDGSGGDPALQIFYECGQCFKDYGKDNVLKTLPLGMQPGYMNWFLLHTNN